MKPPDNSAPGFDPPNSKDDFPRAKQHLVYYGKRYPGAWKVVDEMRSEKGREVPDWPAWCFVPIAGAISIATAFAEKALREQDRLEMRRGTNSEGSDDEESDDETSDGEEQDGAEFDGEPGPVSEPADE